MTKIIGLTGSIAMGKSTAAAMLKRAGCWVHDADAAVHALLAPGGAAVKAVLAVFPDVGDERGGIAEAQLGAKVFANSADLRRLEAILHPLVGRQQRRFLDHCRRERRALAILDVPLLFEGGGNRRCAAVIVVSAPAFLQKQRALRRAGMTEARFRSTLAQQIPDAEKRRRADFVVQSGLGKRFMLLQLRQSLRQLAA